MNKENRTISVTATDKVIAMADTATVHIGFIAYGPDSNGAYATGSRISNGIVKALTAAGIPNDTIESENQNVSPVQPYQIEKLTPAEKAQRQFQVTQSWTVRVPANDAAKTLDLAVKAGANQSGQIDWSFKDENAPEAEAAAKALQRARSQAEQMAGEPQHQARRAPLRQQRGPGLPHPPHGDARHGSGSPWHKVEPLAINPRQIEKTATVHAIFAIE